MFAICPTIVTNYNNNYVKEKIQIAFLMCPPLFTGITTFNKSVSRLKQDHIYEKLTTRFNTVAKGLCVSGVSNISHHKSFFFICSVL